jgi:DNA-binding transcriptional ArsR family regulator
MLAIPQGLIVRLSRTIPSPTAEAAAAGAAPADQETANRRSRPNGQYRPADCDSNRHLVNAANARATNCRLAFAALADPTRWAVFERTLIAPRPVRAIAGGLPVSRAAVSQHLKALREAGLVACRRDGSRRLYRADPWTIGELVSVLDAVRREATAMAGPIGPGGEA